MHLKNMLLMIFNYSCLFCMKLLGLGGKMKGGVMIANYELPVYYKQLRTRCLQIVLPDN
jgi:hypothetical protein